MYYRISGAQFTIKSADEKKEFIKTINEDRNFSNHLICRGVNAEQFTGKVNGIVVCEKNNPNKVYIFNCEGNFPTLKLYQRTSSVVYIIEFPISKKGQTIVEKVEEIKEESSAAESETQEIVEEETPVEPTEEEPVSEPETEDFNQFMQFEVEQPLQEEQPEQPVKKKRGRRKKS